MAHKLTIREDGQAEFAYSGAKPWHQLGHAFGRDRGMLTLEAINLANLNWVVDKIPLVTDPIVSVGADGIPVSVPGIRVPDTFANVRMDTKAVLGVVGSDYTLVQNSEAFGFFDTALGQGGPFIETAGSLEGGKRIFIVAKMPETVEVTPGDVVENYLLLTSAHDGSGTIKVLFTPVRVVCNNTLMLALGAAKSIVSIRHTKNAHKRLKLAHEVLLANKDYWSKVQDHYKALARKELTVTEVKEFLAKLFPGKMVKTEAGEVEDVATRTQNMRDDILARFEGGAIGSELAGKTAWAALNAVSDWIEHGRESRRGVSNWEASVFQANVADLRQRAFDLLSV